MPHQSIAAEIIPTAASSPAHDLMAAPRGPAAPERTVANLIAEVILRGKSARTRRAYRADLTDFLIWLMGYTVQIPLQTDELRQDAPASRALSHRAANLTQCRSSPVRSVVRPSAHPSACG